jgi:hypothetical protein
MALPTSPWRHWRSYGTEPLPTAAEAMTEPMRAFLGEAHKLFDEISNLLTELRRPLLGSGGRRR